MKDEDIKLPEMPIVDFGKSWEDEMQEYARQAVRMNMPQPKPSDPEPFDLARAMAGEPIVTRDGRKVRFLGHVPEFNPKHRITAAIEGNKSADSFHENGRYMEKADDDLDLFMAPKPKSTVWVNMWKNGFGNIVSSCHKTKEEALYCAQNVVTTALMKKAHPIEIDA